MQYIALKTFVGFLILMSFLVFQTQKACDITGIWLSDEENDLAEQLTIYREKRNRDYRGKDRPGSVVLKDLVYNESDKEYSGKWVASGGHELSATVTFMEKDLIKITIRTFLHKRSFTVSRVEEVKQP